MRILPAAGPELHPVIAQMEFGGVYVGFYVVLTVVDVIIYRREPDWIETWNFYFGIVMVTSSILGAAWRLGLGDWGSAFTFLMAAVLSGWFWWDSGRRRRKKLADKASGIVTDVGGRLKVVRAPVSET